MIEVTQNPDYTILPIHASHHIVNEVRLWTFPPHSFSAKPSKLWNRLVKLEVGRASFPDIKAEIGLFNFFQPPRCFQACSDNFRKIMMITNSQEFVQTKALLSKCEIFNSKKGFLVMNDDRPACFDWSSMNPDINKNEHATFHKPSFYWIVSKDMHMYFT